MPATEPTIDAQGLDASEKLLASATLAKITSELRSVIIFLNPEM
jgi:hypothetical protein